jgi:NADH:ubiquinone oxidoreductase subunit 3 (subunit A)
MYAPDTEKTSAYECGFDPYEDARNVFDIRFYLVAILFIIFDLEAVYFFPWCMSLSFLSADSFWGMIDFIFELGIGLIYAWEVGALDN